MTLKERGHRFYVSPDKSKGKWMAPAIAAHFHADWTDVTDWPNELFTNWLMT